MANAHTPIVTDFPALFIAVSADVSPAVITPIGHISLVRPEKAYVTPRGTVANSAFHI
jgi:hypothetical protein